MKKRNNWLSKEIPFGVASIAAGFRAESPATNSTGQRPVGIRASQQPALKGRNPVIWLDAALSGLRKQVAFIHRALPCANDDRAFSPEPDGDGLKITPSRGRGFFILLCLLLWTASLFAQSILISVPPQNGKGKQTVSIHSCGGQAKAEEGAYNLLYNAAEGANSKKKWCNTSNLYPWVVFELNDIYTIDKLIFRDVKPYESNFANVPEYWVYISLESPDNCSWTEVAHQRQQGALDVKEITFDPVNARYIKFVASRGIKPDNKYDNAIRIYGLDIYGILSEKTEKEAVSAGKTVLDFNASYSYYERPLHLLDGNTTSVNNHWRAGRPAVSDTLSWVIIDLEQMYDVNKFRLYDAKFLDKGQTNLSGYNVYASAEEPDLSKIGRNKDDNTCWTKVVDAYAEDRAEQNIKTDEIAPVRARYIKLEIPRSRISAYIQIYQFEVFGEEAPTALPEMKTGGRLEITSNPVKSGYAIPVQGTGYVKIYSSQGVLLKEQSVSGGSTAISSAGMTPGVYFVQLFDGNKDAITEKYPALPETKKLIIK
jgi:hypothetical protein